MRYALRPLTALMIALAAPLTAISATPAQNPLDALRKAAADAKKKADEIKRVADSTRRANDSTKRAVAGAKAAAEGAKASVEEAARSATTINPSRAQPAVPPHAASPGASRSPAGRAPAGNAQSPTTGVSMPTTAATQARSGAKVEEQLLVTGEPGLQYWISPRGQHVAAVVLRGSRMVVVHDGVEGPRFDDIMYIPAVGSSTRVVFSDDGSRFAYVGRQGQEWIVMLDGKELARGSPYSQMTGSPSVTSIDFTPGDKHLYFTTFLANSQSPVGKLHIDGKPGPASEMEIQPVFSPDGERHTYVISVRNQAGTRAQQLILDGKPSPYPGGEPQFTTDGLHVFTRMAVRGAEGMDIFADGKPFMRASNAQLYFAPSGSGVLAVVWTPFQNGVRSTFLTVGNRRVPNSDCRGMGGIDRVYFSPDAKHWAVRCQDSNASYWVMADGKKGRDYQAINGSVEFLADGRPVYSATMNGKYFVIVGEEELGPYQSVQVELPESQRFQAAPEMRAVVVSGNRYGFVALPAPGNARVVVVDGKPSQGVSVINLAFSPDGSRFAYINGIGHHEVVLDGAQPLGPPLESVPRAGKIPTFTFSPDAKHIAYASFPTSNVQGRSVAIDGKLFMTETTQNFAIAFTPDSKHLTWIGQRPGVQRQLVFVDGEPVLEVDQTPGLQNEPDVYTAMGSDGTLTLVAQHGGALKRFRVTPGTSSIETMLAKAVKP